MIELVDKHIKIDIMIVFCELKKLNMLSGDIKTTKAQDSLVVQWLKSHLAMLETLVRALKIPQATEQLSPCTPKSVSTNCGAHTQQLLKPACPGARVPQEETPQ